MLQAFLSEPTLEGLYRIGSVVTTVDAVNGPGTLDEHVESVRQVALADHILITKLDLVPADQVQATVRALKARLHALNPAADIVLAGEAAAAPVRLLRDTGFDPAKGGEAVRAWLNAEALRRR